MNQLHEAFTKGYLNLENATSAELADEDGISLSLETVGIGAVVIAIVVAIAAIAVPDIGALASKLISKADGLVP